MLNGEKLYFVLDDKSDLPVDSENSVKILSPISDVNDGLTPISCPDEILAIIHGRYQSNEQFVGGMGENDAGVWFTCLYGGDPLVGLFLMKVIATLHFLISLLLIFRIRNTSILSVIRSGG